MKLKKEKKSIGKKVITYYLCAALFILTATATITLKPKQAKAAFCCRNCCTCLASTISEDLSGWVGTWLNINIYITTRLVLHRQIFMDTDFWQQSVLPSLMKAGVTFSAIGSYQVSIIGMFIDAKEQMETQRLLQRMHARTHKDYQPSIGMCEFGTRVTTLASSERQGEVNVRILSQRSTDRLLGATGTATGTQPGVSGDIITRLSKFQTAFCDVKDNNSSLDSLCPQLATASLSAAEKERLNSDIDYQRVIADPLTIPFNLIPGGAPNDEEETIFAMASNLYGFDAFGNGNFAALQNEPDNDIVSMQQAYLDLRATVAKTKVAENSFNAIIGMKSEGTNNASRVFIASYLEELGMPSAEIDQFLGQNPSYYAQMEVLTKKAYQSPLFYTNLYDKPANVERKGVAMQAIGLIQKFDLLKSYMRTEASLSVLLELAVIQLQREVEDNILGFQKNRSATQE